MSYYNDDRPTGEYESAMTAGAAWPNVTPLQMAEGVIAAKEFQSWAEEEVERNAYWRREVHDTFQGEDFEPMYKRVDHFVNAAHRIHEVATADARAWSTGEAILNQTKNKVLEVVEKGLQAIRQVQQNNKATAAEKATAIGNIVAEAHAQNVETVAAGAASLPELTPGDIYTPLASSGRTSPSPTQSNGSGASGAQATPMGNHQKSDFDDGDGTAANQKGNKPNVDDRDSDKKEKGEKGDKKDTDHRKAGSDFDDKDSNAKEAESDKVKHVDFDDRPVVSGSPSSPQSPSAGTPSAIPMSGAGAGGGAQAGGGAGSSLSGLGRGGGQGISPSPSPSVSPASLSPTAMTNPASEIAPRSGSSLSSGGSAPPFASSPAPLPVTAATNSPAPAVPPPPPIAGQPPAAPASVTAPAATAAPMVPPMMGPPPATATPLGGSSASSLAGAAPVAPNAPSAVTAGPSATASIVPVTAAERARRSVVRGTRQLIGDVAGESRRLAAALTASSKKRPDLQWCVGGCPDDGDGPLMIVASNIGLGFIPAKTELPRHTAVHVFGESSSVSWGLKRAWLGDPVAAVIGYGRAVGRPVTVVAGLASVVSAAQGVGIELVTEESIPMTGVLGGRRRLEVVNPELAEKAKTVGTAGLAEMMPAAGTVELEPDNARTLALWTDAVLAADVDDIHQLKTWQAFCAEQAAVSAYKVTRAENEDTAHEYFEDYQYFSWNVRQVEAAFADIRASARDRVTESV